MPVLYLHAMNAHPTPVIYQTGITPATEQIMALYRSAGLKRPIEDAARITRMFEHSNLVVSAWAGEELIGVARALTDYSYCCYLSDLAVALPFQRLGIGRQLIARIREKAGPQCMLLLSAPGAKTYYPTLGMKVVDNGFIIPRES